MNFLLACSQACGLGLLGFCIALLINHIVKGIKYFGAPVQSAKPKNNDLPEKPKRKFTAMGGAPSRIIEDDGNGRHLDDGE